MAAGHLPKLLSPAAPLTKEVDALGCNEGSMQMRLRPHLQGPFHPRRGSTARAFSTWARLVKPQ